MFAKTAMPGSAPQPGVYTRLLANWGLSLSGSACLMPVQESRCPLRPLLQVGQRVTGKNHVG